MTRRSYKHCHMQNAERGPYAAPKYFHDNV